MKASDTADLELVDADRGFVWSRHLDCCCGCCWLPWRVEPRSSGVVPWKAPVWRVAEVLAVDVGTLPPRVAAMLSETVDARDSGYFGVICSSLRTPDCTRENKEQVSPENRDK